MSYRIVSSIVAGVCAVLFVMFVAIPQSYAPTYGVGADAGALFMTRRAGPMFLGLAIILWLSRDEPLSKLRSAIAYGVAVCFVGVALTGVFAWGTDVAAPTVLVAALAELALAALLVYTART